MCSRIGCIDVIWMGGLRPFVARAGDDRHYAEGRRGDGIVGVRFRPACASILAPRAASWPNIFPCAPLVARLGCAMGKRGSTAKSSQRARSLSGRSSRNAPRRLKGRTSCRLRRGGDDQPLPDGPSAARAVRRTQRAHEIHRRIVEAVGYGRDAGSGSCACSVCSGWRAENQRRGATGNVACGGLRRSAAHDARAAGLHRTLSADSLPRENAGVCPVNLFETVACEAVA